MFTIFAWWLAYFDRAYAETYDSTMRSIMTFDDEELSALIEESLLAADSQT